MHTFDADTIPASEILAPVAAVDPDAIVAVVRAIQNALVLADADKTDGGLLITAAAMLMLERLALPGRAGEVLALAAVCFRARAEQIGPKRTR